ncbi:MAG: 3-dehydroquinate synthase [Rhodospirillales bacterium]|nr:3-dehydroquinate synthase [Rhodospirillales bacterium]MCB9995894.1 3-dehydroquinate synthase [Rhodospirillales bacterium]
MSNTNQAEPSPEADRRTVRINLGERSYDIHIGQNLLRQITDFVPVSLEKRSVFVLTDENVSIPHAGQVYEAVKAGKPHSVQLLALPPGEATKSMASLEQVIAWMLDHGVNRDSVLFAVGGGVIGDLAGFAAATVMRGIDFVQVPTTLLAQVDSSVGGKTGINMPQGKNLVGVFHQPISVVCDIDTLATLPRREILAGYAEIVKYGLIDDPSFFQWLEKEGQDVCAPKPGPAMKAIEISCRKKAEIVAADEKEKGMRALLNLGHTFGHALEGAAGYDGRLLHGEAVAIGMVLAMRLSHRMGLCEEKDISRVVEHLAAIGLPTEINMIFPPLETTPEELLGFMRHDKKVSMGRMIFIIANGIGKAHATHDAEQSDILEILKHSMDGP